MTFEEIAPTFWDAAIGHGVQEPLTDDALDAAQRTLGHTLPPELVGLLRIRNGGHLRRELRAHRSPEPTAWAETWIPFDECYGIGTDGISLLDTPYLIEEWGLPDGLVLLAGDGHWWIALDHRPARRWWRWPRRRSGTGEDQPPVIYVDSHSGHEILLAPSFRTFVEGLIPPPD